MLQPRMLGGERTSVLDLGESGRPITTACATLLLVASSHGPCFHGGPAIPEP
jgi:hypothetical protein